MSNEVKKGDNVGPPKEPRGDSLTTPDDPEFARQKAPKKSCRTTARCCASLPSRRVRTIPEVLVRSKCGIRNS